MKVINTGDYEAHMQLPDGSVRLLQPGESVPVEDATSTRPKRERRTPLSAAEAADVARQAATPEATSTPPSTGAPSVVTA